MNASYDQVGEVLYLHSESDKTKKRVLAVASAGGHWVQLLRLRPAFEHSAVHFVTTNRGLQHQVGKAPFHVVRDANRWDKFGLLIMLMQILWLIIRIRPHVVVTTGAAPGYFAIRCAKFLGAKTLWLDSIANSEELSHSGKMAGRVADAWLTQWPELADEDFSSDSAEENYAGPERRRHVRTRHRRPEYHGAVL